MLFGIFASADKKKGKEVLKPTERAYPCGPLARRASRSTSQSSNDSTSTASSTHSQSISQYPQNFVPFAFIQSPTTLSEAPGDAKRPDASRTAASQLIPGQPSTASRSGPTNPDMPFAQQRMVRMPSEVMPQITRSGALMAQTHEVREATMPCLAYQTPRATVASEDFGAPPAYERARR